MADHGAGGLDRQAAIVCEAYLGRPLRREGRPATPEERVVWRCTECGGEFAATASTAGCMDPDCPAPHDANAFEIVAHFEGLSLRKDLRQVIRVARDIVTRHDSEEARARQARARAEAKRRASAQAARTADDEEREAGDGPCGANHSGTHHSGEPKTKPARKAEEEGAGGGAVVPPDELEEYRLWKERTRREWEEGQRERERELREERREEARERHEKLVELVIAGHVWATPREIAGAVAAASFVAVVSWLLLTGGEAAYDWIAEVFGLAGAPDYEVGHIEVGSLGGHTPTVVASPPQAGLHERLEEAWREHHRIVIALIAGTVAAAATGRRLAAERHAANALPAEEYLVLRRPEETEE